ncbi:MAG TPA: DUF2600 family protein [Solirubrobacterales bacterium]|nr:DUF2600 family protein [Solirubrobacterales bacterium]
MTDPLPLSRRQVRALAAAVGRELSWGRPQIDKEVHRWSRLAAQIPDESIRSDALRTFDSKRGHVAGAALFSTLPRDRSSALLRALISFEVIVDFLDDVHERHPTAANGSQLHLAAVDAFKPGEPLGHYYAHHPTQNDGGYLSSLVEACRRDCEALPSFAAVQPLLVREADRARQSLTFNHLPDPAERERAIRNWAKAEYPDQGEWHWFELCAAASGQLTIFALLALAASPSVDEREVAATYDAYWPLLGLVTNMLDSFADQAEDRDNGNHQYIAYYGEPGRLGRVSELIERAAAMVMTLPNGPRHAVIFSCMVTFYLAKDSAHSPAMRTEARQLAQAGGTLPRTLLPVLRIWRTAYAQRSA